MGGWLVLGSVVFLVGAAVAVPQVFMTPDPHVRLRLLELHSGAWRVGQVGYAAGPLLVAAGVAAGAGAADDGALPLAASAVLLLVGAIAWGVDVVLRSLRVRDFALGGLPGWPFVVYVTLTCVGLALLGVGLLAAGAPGWLGWSVVVLSGAFLAAYAVARDIPPFVFYLLTLVVGGVLATG